MTKRFFAEGEQRIGGSDAGNYYYTRDHLGSIREVTDSTGAVRAQYEYDPFGVRTKISGDANLDADFGFTGHWHHGPSGLDLALYRAYSSTLGRWISRDPIGEMGGLNLYGYISNNPINGTDPLGLIWAGPLPEGPYRCAQRIRGEVWNRPNVPLDDPSRREDHCIANCRISRECLGGAVTATVASWWKENVTQSNWNPWRSGPSDRPWWDPRGWNPNDSLGDDAANKKGRDAAKSDCNKTKSCEELCKGTR